MYVCVCAQLCPSCARMGGREAQTRAVHPARSREKSLGTETLQLPINSPSRHFLESSLLFYLKNSLGFGFYICHHYSIKMS